MQKRERSKVPNVEFAVVEVEVDILRVELILCYCKIAAERRTSCRSEAHYEERDKKIV
jgi:hypothetical protein